MLIKSIKIDPLTGCWIWQKSKNLDGYGQTCYNSKQIGAHVLSKILFDEYVENLVCDHLCKKRDCVNPDHIRMTTNRDNILNENSDNPSAINLRKTICSNGHALSEENTYIEKVKRSNGDVYNTRRCRACKNIKEQKRRERKKLLNLINA